MLSVVYIGLAHFPVYNKNREVIASALTTIDMHDLARLGATYGAAGFYVITPVEDQTGVAREMIDHWQNGWGASYNPNRSEAFSLIRMARDLDEVREDILGECGRSPLLVGTSAAEGQKRISFPSLREKLQDPGPILIVFGTAWGLTEETLADFDFILEPVKGPTKYNHLSVRSAAGIIMDRLFGR